MAQSVAEVVFRDIQKCFPEDSDIECRYTVQPSLVPTKRDWVGIFKVGWSSHKDFIYYDWSKPFGETVTGQECQCNVLFPAAKLPKDDGEFYQFVYFNDKNQMRGASSPFQFRKPQADDYQETFEEDDMLVVSSKFTILEDKIGQMERERDKILQEKKALDEDREQCMKKLICCEESLKKEAGEKIRLNTELQICKQKLEELDKRCKESHANRAALNEQLATLSDKMQSMEMRCQAADQEVADLKSTVESQTGTIMLLTDQKDALDVQLQSIATELDNVKRETSVQTADLDIERKRVLDELFTTRQHLKCLEEEKEAQHVIIFRLTDQLNASEARRDVYATEISVLSAKIALLTDQMSQTKTENARLQAVLIEKNGDLEAQQRMYDNNEQDWSKTMDDLVVEKNVLLSRIGELTYELDQVNSQQKDTYDEQQDRYIALKEAYRILKEELAQQMEETKAARKKEARLVQKEKELEVQVRDLMERLRLGKEEWTGLFQEKTRLETQLAKRSRKESSDRLNRSAGTVIVGSGPSATYLQASVEQLTVELEKVKANRDKYRQKYALSKEKYAEALSIMNQHGRTSSKYSVSPIVYPPIAPAGAAVCYLGDTQQPYSAQFHQQPSSIVYPAITAAGRAVDSVLEAVSSSHTVALPNAGDCLKPLPIPMEPQRGPARGADDTSDLMASAIDSLSVASNEAGDVSEWLISDDDNEGTEGFHDAVDYGPTSCMMCHAKFRPTDTLETKAAHINEHMEEQQVGAPLSEGFQECPICRELFLIADGSRFQEHVETHFV